MNNELEDVDGNCMPLYKLYFENVLKRLRETTKPSVRIIGLSPGQGLNLEPPEYEAILLHTRWRRSIIKTTTIIITTTTTTRPVWLGVATTHQALTTEESGFSCPLGQKICTDRLRDPPRRLSSLYRVFMASC